MPGDPIRDYFSLFPASANAYYRHSSIHPALPLPLHPLDHNQHRHADPTATHPYAATPLPPPLLRFAQPNDAGNPIDLTQRKRTITGRSKTDTQLRQQKFKSLDGLCVMPDCVKRVRSKGALQAAWRRQTLQG